MTTHRTGAFRADARLIRLLSVLFSGLTQILRALVNLTGFVGGTTSLKSWSISNVKNAQSTHFHTSLQSYTKKF